MPITSPIIDQIPQLADYFVALYKEFHQHPELSMQETWTVERIEKELREKVEKEVREKAGREAKEREEKERQAAREREAREARERAERLRNARRGAPGAEGRGDAGRDAGDITES